MTRFSTTPPTRIAAALLIAGVASSAVAQGTPLRSICRVKGQEENVLRGVGLVVGLNGTGEANDTATMRALSRSLELMGNPVSMTGRFDEQAVAALKNVKNVALVMVTATVPPTGARRGNKIDCHVSALNGSSLAGGRLAFAALQGPNTRDRRVFALCQGAIQIEDEAQPMVGYVHNGCQLEQDLLTRFVSDDGYVTFVLDRNHADFLVANDIAEKIASSYSDQYLPEDNDGSLSAESRRFDAHRHEFVHAIDAANIRVKLPDSYDDDPVAFIAELLETRIYSAEPEPRVIVNTKTGSIVISGDVEIGDVIFTHRNIVVETGPAEGFYSVSPRESNLPKLQRLVDALSHLRVPAEDKIEIIRGIEAMGALHAKLILL